MAHPFDLFAIKTHATGAKQTEVHVLGAAHQHKNFIQQTGTALHEVHDGSFHFLVAANRDLFCIKKRKTGTKKTEVHVLSAANGYQGFALQTGTALHKTDHTFDFALSPNRDIFCFKKSKTGSNSTEIHVLSAASNYQTFALQTGTCLHETGHNFKFLVANNGDVIALKLSETGAKATEVHVLAAASGYKSFSLQTGTALHETDPFFWDFAVQANRDIVCVKKANTGSNSTEVHVLSAASGYRAFALQTGTSLHHTGHNFHFAIPASQ